jgi:hypothetical protein
MEARLDQPAHLVDERFARNQQRKSARRREHSSSAGAASPLRTVSLSKSYIPVARRTAQSDHGAAGWQDRKGKRE